VKAEPLTGLKAADKTYKVHLDGYNFLPYFKGQMAEGPRKDLFYFAEAGTLEAGIDRQVRELASMGPRLDPAPSPREHAVCSRTHAEAAWSFAPRFPSRCGEDLLS